jgi:hypothetical protein
MSDYLNRVIYDTYAHEHHKDLIQLSEKERLLRDSCIKPINDQKERSTWSGFQLRLAYIVALVLLAALLITQVVVATFSGGGGGGAYLVR